MRPQGISVVELLVTLAIAALLIGFAIPGFSEFLARQRSIAAVNQLIGSVNFARSAAVIQRATVSLCPAARAQCAERNQWHLGAMIFKDNNQNGVRDADDVVIAQLPALRIGERAVWRSFRNKPYLQFRSTGLTSWQNGSFQYCPADGDPQYSKAIIINAQGRVAKTRDANQDGIDEDASGRPLSCG